MRKTLILLTIIALNCNLFAQSEQDAIFYKNGLELLDQNKYEAAIYYFNKAIKINPYISIYYHNRGFAKSMIQDLDGALDDYKKANTLVPEEPLYYYLMGNIYNEQVKYIEAITNYTTAYELDSTDYMYPFNRGNLYLKLKDYSNAIIDYNESIRINSQHYGSYNNRAIAKFKLNDIQGACVDWDVAYKNGSEFTKEYLQKYCNNLTSDSTIGNFNVIDNAQKDLKKQSIYNVLPSFYNDGTTGFRQFVMRNIRYPVSALQNGEHGKVIVKFFVMKDGSIDSIKIINSVTPTLDTEAVRLVLLSEGYWSPGNINGKTVDIPMIIPIEFNLGGIKNRKSIKTSVKNKLPENTTENKVSNYNFKNVTVYYDSIWQVTSKKKANYYRIAQWDPFNNFFHGKYTDYSIDSIKFGQGKFYNNMKNDTMILYYPTGQIRCKGYYFKNIPINKWHYYYANGKLKQSVVFTDKSFFIETYRNENDSLLVENGTGNWQMNALNGLKTINYTYEGEFKKGNKTGSWKIYQDSELLLEEIYKNNQFFRGKLYDLETGIKTKLTSASITSWIFDPIHLLRSVQFIFDSPTSKTDYKFGINNK